MRVSDAFPLARGGRATYYGPCVEADCRLLVETVRVPPICLPWNALPLRARIPRLAVAPPPQCAAFRAPAIGIRPLPTRFPPYDTCSVLRGAVHRVSRMEPNMEGEVAAAIPLVAARIPPGSDTTWPPLLASSLETGVRDPPPWRRTKQ